MMSWYDSNLCLSIGKVFIFPPCCLQDFSLYLLFQQFRYYMPLCVCVLNFILPCISELSWISNLLSTINTGNYQPISSHICLLHPSPHFSFFKFQLHIYYNVLYFPTVLECVECDLCFVFYFFSLFSLYVLVWIGSFDMPTSSLIFPWLYSTYGLIKHFSFMLLWFGFTPHYLILS